MALLEVENLSTEFQTKEGIVNAVDNVSFQIDNRERVGIVGESGAGKSVTGLSILNLIDETGAIDEDTEILWKGDDLLAMKGEDMDNIRGNEIAWIPQDPLSALNPTRTIGRQIIETMLTHDFAPKKMARKRAISLLEDVDITDAENRLSDYPSQFSGGMRQRVLIAIALSCDPDLIIADEPTTALDVLTQIQLIQLLHELSDQHNTAILLITHDLGLVAELAETVMVMYAGEIVEKSDVVSLFDNPLHPYTVELMNCSPSLNKGDKLNTIPGTVPDATNYPSGCRFHPRCDEAMEVCTQRNPVLQKQSEDTEVACLLYDDHEP